MDHGLKARARVVALDWSGRRTGAERSIWLAEVRTGGIDERGSELVRLEDGRTRDQIADHLVELAGEDGDLVVGLDFSFSLPAWFLQARGWSSAAELWDVATDESEDWLRDVRPPFWGTRGHRRPRLPEGGLRATERSIAVGGITPKSTFQVSGAGSVGAGSLRGFPVLARLRAAGFSVWPFDDAVPPVLFEVWPRLLTGPVVKSCPDARACYVDEHLPDLDPELRSRAVRSDDAFDAAVSAVVMARHVHDLLSRRRATDERTRFEGAVWCPSEVLYPSLA